MLRNAVVLGTGLIGTSIALALRENDVEVALADPEPASLRMAHELGAGEVLAPGVPASPADIAVVAAPPSAVPAALREAQERGLAQVYTDAASVKDRVAARAEQHGCDMSTYVPGHPMGGREKNGPSAARADLFLGRPWALCPTGKADAGAVTAVTELVRTCGAEPHMLTAAAHDRAVALVSHAPHVASSAVAARMLTGEEEALALAGQGVRDVTRVAGGDPELWWEILRNNPRPVAAVLEEIATDLARAARALNAADPDREVVWGVLERGVRGHERIPGKHGARQEPEYAVLPVVIPDEPNALGRLFVAVGEVGVNVEDVRIDHSPGLPVGVAQLWVLGTELPRLSDALAAHGWSVHG